MAIVMAMATTVALFHPSFYLRPMGVLKTLIYAVRLARYQERTKSLAFYFVGSMFSAVALNLIAVYDYYAKPQAVRIEIFITIATQSVIFATGLLMALQKLVFDSRDGYLHTRLQPFHFRSNQEQVLEA